MLWGSELRPPSLHLPIYPIHFPKNIRNDEYPLGAEHCAGLHSEVGGPVPELEGPQLLREIGNLHTDGHL